MIIKKYNYNLNTITSLSRGTDNLYLWLAFDKIGTVCNLYKTSLFNPYQIYYNVEVSADRINDLKVDSSYIYLGIEQSLNLGLRYAQIAPVSVVTTYVKPLGINENTLAIAVTSTHIYFLLPGILSGENAKICKFTLSGSFVETIDLTGINQAISLSIVGTDIWVVTNENPSKLIRVYDPGSGYVFATWDLNYIF